MSIFSKLEGGREALPPKPIVKSVLLAWIGGFLAISAVVLLSDTFSAALVLGSFGATCVLVFGFPDSPFSQPRNIIFGHLLS